MSTATGRRRSALPIRDSFPPVADVRPIRALHYDLAVAGELGDVAAPPYDVIDTELRAELLARSPYNAVAIDLPKPYGRAARGRRRPLRDGRRDDRGLARGRGAGRRPRARDLGDDPGLHRPRRREPHPSRHPLPRPGRGLRRRPGPPPRAHPAGAEEGPADLTRATRHNLSPIFSLSTEDPWPLVEAAIDPDSPWGEATDEGGTVTRLWRVGDPEVLERSPSCSPAPSC